MKYRFYLILVLFLCISIHGIAQQFLLSGKVMNSQLEPLSFVTVQLKNVQIGTKTNDKGVFEFQLYEGEYELVFSLIGYKKQTIKIIHRKGNEKQNIILEENSNETNEVKIMSFRKDKAEEFIRNVIQHKEQIKSAANTYTAHVYIRATQENELTLSKKQQKKLTDSARIVLENKLPTMSMSEVSLNLDYGYPDKIKETREGIKNRGNTESLFFRTTTDGDFSLYNNLVKIPALSEMPMLSPISYSGLVAYKYKTKKIEKFKTYTLYTIQFSPTKLGNALLEGEVQLIDTSWSIFKATFSFPKYHMPEYDFFEAHQEYDFVDAKAWLPIRQEFVYFSKSGKNKSSGRTIAIYDNYKIDTQFAKRHFNTEISKTTVEAYKRDSSFWNTERKEPLNANEVKFIIKSDSIYRATHNQVYYDSVDKAYNKITFLKLFFLQQGHYNRKKETNIYLAPFITTVRPFLPGGTRVGLNIEFSKLFESKKFVDITVDASYGIRNHDVLGNLSGFYTYNPFSQGYVKFEVGRSFDLIYKDDAFINLFRRSNFYLKNNVQLEHGLELVNGLILRTSAEFAERKSIDYLTLNHTYDSVLYLSNSPIEFKPYNTFYTSVSLEYTPFQMYLREPLQKIILGSKYPTLYVKWRYGIPNIFNSAVDFNYLEVGLTQKIKLGLAGISQFRILSGEFLSQNELKYIDYKIIRRGDPFLFNNPLLGFQSLDSTLSIFHRFYEGHYIHHFNGAIINKVPLLKKLNLLEVMGGGVLMLPERNLRYAEAFMGIEKAFPLFKERFKIGFYFVGSFANKFNNPYQIKFGLDKFNKRTNSWYY